MIKSNEIGAEGRKRVYDTVGFTFINRLLATGENQIMQNTDCTEHAH